MTQGRRRILLIGLGIVMISMAVYIVILHVRIYNYGIRPPASDSDSEIVERSYQALARIDNVSIDRAKANHFAVSMHFSDKKCIQIRPTRDSMGWEWVFCYDRQGRLVEQYQMGQ